MDIVLPITGWTALANALLLMALTAIVIRHRRGKGIVLGDGDVKVVHKAIRGQANAAEQIPVTLIVLGLAELGGAPSWWLAPCALLFTLGRLVHGAYFGRDGLHWRLRFYGMLATLTSQAGLILALFVTLLG